MSIRLLLLLGLLTLGFAAPWRAPAPAPGRAPTIQEWNVPWSGTRPRDPSVDAEGRVWFVGQTGDYIGVLEPTSGNFRRYELDPGTGPHNLIVGADGMVWYSGNRAAHIGRLDPATGNIRKYPMPDPAARDPHTLVFDSHGLMWFTVQSGNFAGRFRPTTGKVDLIPVPTPNARPYGIVIDRDDQPWIAEFGSHKLATIDRSTLALREVPLPREGARPRRLAVTGGRYIWYGDYAGGLLGRYDPATGEFHEWPLPAGRRSLPYGMATGRDGSVWIAETGPQPNRLVRFDPDAGQFTDTLEVPSGGGTIRHMMTAPNGDIWFGTDANTIGRIRPGN